MIFRNRQEKAGYKNLNNSQSSMSRSASSNFDESEDSRSNQFFNPESDDPDTQGIMMKKHSLAFEKFRNTFKPTNKDSSSTSCYRKFDY